MFRALGLRRALFWEFVLVLDRAFSLDFWLYFGDGEGGLGVGGCLGGNLGAVVVDTSTVNCKYL
jgi:hypothetical protein